MAAKKARFARCLRPYSARANGFTLIQALISLLVASLVASLCAMQYRAIGQALSIREESQVEFAILQLRELAAASRKVRAENGALILEREGKTETIRADQGRLVKTPGYEIFIEQIDGAQFVMRDDSIELELIHENRRSTWQIR